MTASVSQIITLEEFLKLPYIEDSPAWEYSDGVAIQKPMPKFRHSIIQKRLLRVVDDNSDDYTALPELRCTFAGRSIVPDVAVVAWNRIQLNEIGEPIDNILHCLQNGCQLGWLIDPDDYSILILTPQQEPKICRANTQLKILEGIDLTLSTDDVFGWLKISEIKRKYN